MHEGGGGHIAWFVCVCVCVCVCVIVRFFVCSSAPPLYDLLSFFSALSYSFSCNATCVVHRLQNSSRRARHLGKASHSY